MIPHFVSSLRISACGLLQRFSSKASETTLEAPTPHVTITTHTVFALPMIHTLNTITCCHAMGYCGVPVVWFEYIWMEAALFSLGAWPLVALWRNDTPFVCKVWTQTMRQAFRTRTFSLFSICNYRSSKYFRLDHLIWMSFCFICLVVFLWEHQRK